MSLPYQICPRRSRSSYLPTWKIMCCDFSIKSRTKLIPTVQPVWLNGTWTSLISLHYFIPHSWHSISQNHFYQTFLLCSLWLCDSWLGKQTWGTPLSTPRQSGRGQKCGILDDVRDCMHLCPQRGKGRERAETTLWGQSFSPRLPCPVSLVHHGQSMVSNQPGRPGSPCLYFQVAFSFAASTCFLQHLHQHVNCSQACVVFHTFLLLSPQLD